MNLSDLYAAGAASNVTILDTQTFDTSGTWTKPTSIAFAPDDMALIELWGGGGAGSSGTTSAGNYTALGGGGGSYLRIAVLLSTLAATEAVVVGAGGVAASTPGGGGDSSFAGFVAPGGRGGRRIQTSDPDFTMAGYLIQPPVSLYTPGAGGFYISSVSGNGPARRSIYGGSGGEASSGSNPGIAPGGGGGASSSTGTGSRGGDGAPGRVRVQIIRGLNNFEISEGPL